MNDLLPKLENVGLAAAAGVGRWSHAHTRTAIAAALGLAVCGWLYLHEAHNKGQELEELKTFIAQKEAERAKDSAELKAELAAVKAKNAELEQRKQQVMVQPATAPQVIREFVPTSAPIQQTAPINKDTPADAVVAELTLKQEQELAQFGIACRQCQNDLKAQQDVAAKQQRDIERLTAERDQALLAAKGGSAWHRVGKILKVAGCGGLGAGAGAQVKRPGSAAIGAAAGVVVCSVMGK